MKYKLNISVHNLVDSLLRTGDIDNRVFNENTMSEGSRIHRYYQSKMNANYMSEYFLSYDFSYDEYEIHIEGRADGLIKENDFVIIDEIKSTNIDIVDFHKLNENWHLGQAKVYAFIYCKTNNIDKARVTLTYISQIDNSQKKFFYEYDFSELEEFFFTLINDYISFEMLLTRHKEDRNKELSNIPFPYNTLNKNQDKLIDCIDEVLNESHSRTLIEAATGIGKTISILYPSLKRIKDYDRIFYLTAKSSGKETVNDTIVDMIKTSHNFKTIFITSKEKICPLNEPMCNPDNCPYAKGYFNKIREVIKEAFLSEVNVYDYDFFKGLQEKHFICPFEFQLDLSLCCDLIIGDYNYVFDPFVYLERYINNDLSSSLLLVDEGHNLLDRCRSMYSSEISYSKFVFLKKKLRGLKNPKAKYNLNKIIKYMEQYFSDTETYDKLYCFDSHLIKLLEKFIVLYREQSKADYKKINKVYKNTFLDINRFIKIYQLVAKDESFIQYMCSKKDDAIFKIFCISPTKYINSLTKRFSNTIIFSATMSPFSYYNEVFFNSDETTNFYLFGSPFSDEQLNLMISPFLSLKYKDRKNTLNQVANQVLSFVNSKEGNYLVFTPSYEYLELIHNELLKNKTNMSFFLQEKNMSESDKQDFINKFKKIEKNITKVGICVLGGSFSESINLIGESLIGVVVIGVGMPSLSFENEQIKEYYNLHLSRGYYYAYLIPGMKNVIQAVGRLIRTNSDYGSVLLIDNRYLQTSYQSLFKEEWSKYKVVEKELDITKNINYFYKKKQH